MKVENTDKEALEVSRQSLGCDISVTSLGSGMCPHTLGHTPLRCSPCHPFGATRGQRCGGKKVPQHNLGFTSCLEHRESLYKYQPQQLLLSPLFSLLLPRPSSQAGCCGLSLSPGPTALAPGLARWVPGAEMNHNLSLTLQPAVPVARASLSGGGCPDQWPTLIK